MSPNKDVSAFKINMQTSVSIASAFSMCTSVLINLLLLPIFFVTASTLLDSPASLGHLFIGPLSAGSTIPKAAQSIFYFYFRKLKKIYSRECFYDLPAEHTPFCAHCGSPSVCWESWEGKHTVQEEGGLPCRVKATWKTVLEEMYLEITWSQA